MKEDNNLKYSLIDDYTHPEPMNYEIKFPVSIPKISPTSVGNVINCLIENQVSVRSRFTLEFQDKLKEFYKVPSACACSNGFSAMVIALKNEGITTGDEVLIPSLTMCAVANSVLAVGATPILLDSLPDDFNPNLIEIEKKISPKTKAIIISHTYGVPMDLDPLVMLCKSKNLVLVEDISEAIGVLYKGKYVGTLGDYGCSSLYANKLITAGEGGFMISKKEINANRLFSLVCHGFETNYHFYHTISTGNYKLSGMACGLASGDIELIETYSLNREKIDATYRKNLSKLRNATLMPENKFGPNRPWVFVILLNDYHSLPRVRHLLAENFGIETRALFRPLHLQPFFQEIYGHNLGKFPNSEAFAKCGFYLPTHNNLTWEQMNYISEAVINVIEGEPMTLPVPELYSS